MNEPFPEESFLEKEWIGHGSFGQVYLIRDGERKAAVKEIAVIGDQLEAFEAECNVLKSLDHKYIVKYMGIHETREDFGNRIMGIIMEHCDGGTLKKAISNSKLVYPMFWVLCWANEMFGALEYIHSKSILHRDIKPANIMLHGFDLKLGDFGSTRILSGTCTTAYDATLRYMSPPQIFDSATQERAKRKQSSFKNDVYSMGLVFWEIVERRVGDDLVEPIVIDGSFLPHPVFPRICFSKYGRYEFDYQRFMTDILTKQLIEVEPPKCTEEFQDIIQSCTHFDYSLRSGPEAILGKIRAIMRSYWTDGGIIDAPEYVEEQTGLLRPIGFDGSDSRVEVIDLDSGSASPTPDAHFPNDSDEEVNEKDPFINDDMKKSLHRESFVTAFKKLTSAEREQVQSRIPVIIEISEKSLAYHEHQSLLVYQRRDQPADPSDLDSFLSWIEWHIMMDLRNAFELFTQWHRTLKTCNTRSTNNIACRINYYGIQTFLLWLRRSRRKYYIRRVMFACFFLEQAKEEWFLWEDRVGAEHLSLVNKNFTEIREYRGKWIEKGTFIEKNSLFDEDSAKSNQRRKAPDARERLDDLEVLHYSHTELVETSLLIDMMEREKVKLIRFTKLRNQYLVPLGEFRETKIKLPPMKTEFPVPGYIFQLRNPPRNPCLCESPCRTKGIPKGYADVEMQIFCYDCSKDQADRYLYAFVELCDALNHASSGRKGLMTLKPFEAEIHWRSFVFAQLISEQADLHRVVLLDLPENYKDNERIPCFDHDWNFFTLDVPVVRAALDKMILNEKSFVHMQGPFDL